MILVSTTLVEFARGQSLLPDLAPEALVALSLAATCHLTCLARRVVLRAERNVVWLAGILFGAAAASLAFESTPLPLGILLAASASNAYLTLYRSERE